MTMNRKESALEVGGLLRLALVMGTLLLACTVGTDGAMTEDRARSDEVLSKGDATPPPGRAWVIFGADTVVAELARTPAEREQGLMFREEVPDGTGMLFVFPDEAVRSFWMQNTLVPLDIAWMNADLRVVDIQQMEAESTTTYRSAAPAMFALEVPLGWYEDHGIRVGDVAEIVFGR